MKAWMKGLAVLIILLSPILSGESLLTAGDKKHITAQLACQAPPRDATTGKLIDPGNPIFRDTFSPREEVWVALNVNILKNQEEGARLYVIHHKNGNLSNEDKLDDVTCAYEEISKINLPLGSEGFIYIPVWDHPCFCTRQYDVVLDFPTFGQYDEGIDIVDSFCVPEYWVCLESISFNHTPECGYYDAIDIRQNQDIDISPPEWGKNGKSYPAAYIKNRSVTVEAVFSASTNLKGAYIGACRNSGRLGDVLQKRVKFNKQTTDSKFNSGSKRFQIHLPTPGDVTSFYQEWIWYFQHNNDHNVCYAGKSRNKIFIILAQPQSPWKTKGKSKPWAEALDLPCTWAHGETTPEGAASKITHYLYHHVGGIYDRDSKQYIKNRFSGRFYLRTFLDRIPNVGKVDCVNMGKALVTFSNVVGCGSNYRCCEHFGDSLNYIKPIGSDQWTCTNENYDFHAFGSIGNKIFDATFYYTSGIDYCTREPHSAYVMANISWEDYKEKMVKTPPVSYPETYHFNIVDKK